MATESLEIRSIAVVSGYAQEIGLHDPEGHLDEKFGPHCCRHWYTTWLRRSGMSRTFIQELRGDSRGEAIDTMPI